MKRTTFPCMLICILFIIFACTPAEKAAPDTQWYKGNLHTHSYWSDGDEFPEMIMDWYKSHGYNFLTLSDHNILAEGEFWKVIPDGDIYQQAFEAYQRKFDKDWVVYRENEGKTEVKLKTLAEYKPLFDEEGKFLILQGEEISDEFDGKPIHLNATNLESLILPQGGESVSDVMQNNIDAVLQQREATGIPMIPHLNHPNFHYAIALEDMIQLQGERFFEVYNGHPQVHNLGDAAHMGTEEMWDKINIAYIANEQPLMYGIATDDSHHYHNIDSKWANSGRGWIMVRAAKLDAQSLVATMEAGDFYASTGVTLAALSLQDNTLSLEIAAEEGAQYTIDFIGCKQGDTASSVLHSVEGTKASFTLSSDVSFVRARITSSKLHSNPIETINYEMAWTQPVVFEGK